MTTHEVLVKARGLIAPPGAWVRRAAMHGPYCARGAIAAVQGTWFSTFAPYNALQEAVDAPTARSVIDWNDAPERTHAEVIAAFDRAIAATAPEPDMSWLVAPLPHPEEVNA